MKLNELIEKLQDLQNEGFGDSNVKIDSGYWGCPLRIDNVKINSDMETDNDYVYIFVDNNGL